MIELVLIAHFTGDFVFQTDAMAKGKSKSMFWLSMHIAAYTFILWANSVFMFPFWTATIFAASNGIVHMLVDYFTSRLSSKMWAAGRVHDFFVVIGADQLIHTLTLYWTFLYFTGMQA